MLHELIFKVCLLSHFTGKIVRFDFCPKTFKLRVSSVFHGSSLLTFTTDRLDLKGLDLGKVM